MREHVIHKKPGPSCCVCGHVRADHGRTLSGVEYCRDCFCQHYTPPAAARGYTVLLLRAAADALGARGVWATMTVDAEGATFSEAMLRQCADNIRNAPIAPPSYEPAQQLTDALGARGADNAMIPGSVPPEVQTSWQQPTPDAGAVGRAREAIRLDETMSTQADLDALIAAARAEGAADIARVRGENERLKALCREAGDEISGWVGLARSRTSDLAARLREAGA